LKIVIAGPPIADQVDLVRQASPDDEVVFVPNDASYPGAVGDAEVLYCWNFGKEELNAARSLKWMQCASAGVEWIPLPKFKERGILLTNSAGCQAMPVANTALALLLTVARGLNWAGRHQVAHLWDRSMAIWELAEQTAGVVALGSIGLQIARRLKSLDMRVIGVDVNTAIESEYVDEVRHVDELAWLLGESDVVVIAAPLTAATHHLMNARTFGQMKDGSIFVNVSRGGLVETDALIAALDSGKLFGAGLDVLEDEPLDRDHPLWVRPGCVITPHIGGTSPGRGRRLADLFIDNLQRYRAGRSLRNVVDLDAGY
jgi:phosphoglycerate dehydrogenase-like enzyme